MFLPDCIRIKGNIKIVVCVGIEGLVEYHKITPKDKILLVLYQMVREKVKKLLYNLKKGGVYE